MAGQATVKKSDNWTDCFGSLISGFLLCPGHEGRQAKQGKANQPGVKKVDRMPRLLEPMWHPAFSGQEHQADCRSFMIQVLAGPM